MLDHQPFIETILDRPSDDGPRLVYADWLEERGDPRADWLRLSIRGSKIAFDLQLPVEGSDDVSSWRNRLSRRDASQQLIWIWTCTALRAQPLSHGRRLGDVLAKTIDAQSLVLADLRACGLLTSTQRKKARRLALTNMKRNYRQSNKLAYLASQAIYHVLSGAWMVAVEDAAYAADLSGVRWRASNRWQSALACELLDQPVPQPIYEAKQADQATERREFIEVNSGNSIVTVAVR
jgi:uncharacterized protein (TIGR02996 family)